MPLVSVTDSAGAMAEMAEVWLWLHSQGLLCRPSTFPWTCGAVVRGERKGSRGGCDWGGGGRKIIGDSLCYKLVDILDKLVI